MIGRYGKEEIASGGVISSTEITCVSTSTKPNRRLTPHAGSKRNRRKPAAAGQRLKRKKRNTQQQNAEDDGDHHRDWAALPDLILHSLLGRLFLSADSSAPSTFASVCRSWRSFFATSKQCIVPTLPPLLLRPRWDAPSRAILIWEGAKRPPVHEPFFDVLSTAFPQSKSQLRNDRLANSYICGFSHGYIITMDSRTNRPVLTDPFTGEDLWLFPPPPPNRFEKGAPRKVQLAILTAAPYSKNCRIVLYSPTLLEGFWICKARSSEWSYRHLSITRGTASQLILCRHKIYAMTFSARIVIIDVLFDLPIVDFLPEGCPRIPLGFNIGPFIAEFNGQLLFIHFDPLNPLNPTRTFRIQVYRLSERCLVRMESIGNCALFIETEGFVMACANPGGCGAKENHIYLTGPRCKSWKEVSVGGLVDLPEFGPTESWKRWPRPLWVLPTSCY